MAQFTGFTCDHCDEIVKTKDRVVVRVRFESDDPDLSGESRQDLCPDCAKRMKVEPGIGDVQPLRRRKTKGDEQADDEQHTTLPEPESTPSVGRVEEARQPLPQ